MVDLVRKVLYCIGLLAACFAAGCSGGETPVAPAPVDPGAGALSVHATSAAGGAASVGAAAATATPHPTPTASPTPPTCVPTSNPPIAPATPDPGAKTLASYTINPAKVFVAGISSGGAFAVQMHLAFSNLFKGSAIYAGTVFYCAQDNVGLALAHCGGETLPNCQALYQSELSNSESYVDTQSAAGTIDPVKNLAGQPVYLWSGTQDEVVNPKEMADVDSEYLHYGARVTFDNAFPANHGWESPDGTVACGTPIDPYMIKCYNGSAVYDSEKTWLSMFFGTLRPRNNGQLTGSLINFNQAEFGASASNGLDSNGYVFVPRDCAIGQTCGLVVAFHGCRQFQSFAHNVFVTESGIDEWADRNNFVVLYPYATASDVNPTNPNGCWDWWGYDNDANYALKAGTQPAIVYKMIQRIFPNAPQ